MKLMWNFAKTVCSKSRLANVSTVRAAKMIPKEAYINDGFS